MHTFSENGNSRILHRGSFCRRHDEVAEGFHESSWIRIAVEHERRKRVISIQRDISALLNSRTDFHAVCPQSFEKTVPVPLGHGHDSCAPSIESSAVQLRSI